MTDERRSDRSRKERTRIDQPAPSPDIEPPGRGPEIPQPPEEPRPGIQRPDQRPDVEPPGPDRYEPPKPDEIEPPGRRERESPGKPDQE